MLSFLLLIVIIVLGVSLSRKDKETRQKLDHFSTSYRQGYWDGVRASEQGDSSTRDGNVAPTAPRESFIVGSGQPTAPELPHKENHLTVNIALYVASLLLVGGISVFVNNYIQSAQTAFFFALFAATMYYAFGFVLYETVPMLKPVSVAFVGTALAVMPYVGYLFNQSFIHNGNISWLITSFVCLVAYLYAAIRLHSELIGYFIIVLIVSSADSFAGVFGADILWFIVLVMGAAAAITFVAATRPLWLPEVLKQPFIATQHVLVPLALLWALAMYTQLDAAKYMVVFAVATLYYAAAALQAMRGSGRRTWLWAAARLTITAAASLLVYDKTSSWYMVGMTLAAIGVLQVTGSALSLPLRQKLVNQHEAWLWGGFALIIIAGLFSSDTSHWAAQVAIELAALIAVSAIIAAYLKRSEFLVFCVYGLTLLPLIGGHYSGPSLLANWVITLIYAVLTVLAVLIRKRYVRSLDKTNMTMVYAAQIAFSVMTLVMGSLANGETNHWWLAIAWLIIAVTTYLAAWIEKEYRVIIGANIVTVVALSMVAYALHMTEMQPLYFVAAISLVSFYGAYLALRYRKVEIRIQRIMWGFAFVVSVSLSMIGLFSQDNGLVEGFILLLLVAGVLLVYDDYDYHTLRFTDVGLIIASIGFLKMASILVPDTSGLVYSHWWIALAFILAYLRSNYGKTKRDKDLVLFYQVMGLLIMTLYGFIYIQENGTGGASSIMFLLEHVGLVIYGLIRNNKLFTIWGAVGVTMAILAMMPGYSFILLPLLGLGMIAAVAHVVTRGKVHTLPKE